MITHGKHTEVCSSLEQWCQDDLNLLAEFGAAYFSIPQLFHLRIQLIDRLVMSQRRYNFLFIVLFCSIGWAVFGTGLMVIGFEALAYPVFALFLGCMLVAAVGLIFVNKTSSLGRLNYLLDLVQTELENRQQVVVSLEM